MQDTDGQLEAVGGQFRTTHWSVILSASDKNAADSEKAWGQLCQIYWYPLYAFLRRKGYPPEDSQNLTQEFIGRLLAKDYLHRADRNRGKFRTFLLSAMENFLHNEWDKRKSQKRGGAWLN